MNSETEITQWVREYSDDLFKWALFKTSDKSVSEDLVQDTFLAVLKAIDKFDAQSSPKTWLFSVLNNKIVDHYRSTNRFGRDTTPLDETLALQVTQSFFDDAGNWQDATSTTEWDKEKHLLDNEDFQLVMQNCLNGLPPNWQQAVTAKFFSTKKTSEICQEMGITPTNYWQMVHRAKLLLKKCIETHWTS